MLILFRLLLGVGESIYLPGGTKIVSMLFGPTERGLPCGLFDFGTRMGLVMGGLIIPWLLVRLGWRYLSGDRVLPALLWVIPWLWATKGRLDQRPRPSSSTRNRKQEMRWLLTNRNLIGICLGFFCFDYYWYLFVTWLPDYLVTVRHFTILRAGFFSSLPYFVFGASEPLGGWIADRLTASGWNETRTRKGIVTVAFLSGLLLIPASRVQSANTAVALIAGASLVGLATGNLLVILQCCAPRRMWACGLASRTSPATWPVCWRPCSPACSLAGPAPTRPDSRWPRLCCSAASSATGLLWETCAQISLSCGIKSCYGQFRNDGLVGTGFRVCVRSTFLFGIRARL